MRGAVRGLPGMALACAVTLAPGLARGAGAAGPGAFEPGAAGKAGPAALEPGAAGKAGPGAFEPAAAGKAGPGEGEVRAEVRLLAASQPVTIGDVVTLEIALSGPTGLEVLAPPPGQGTLGSFLLVGIETEAARLRMRLSPAEAGLLEVPAVEVGWRDGAGRSGVLRSEPQPLRVESVLQGGEQDLADIKPAAPVLLDWPALLLRWGLAAAALGAVALAAWFGLKTWKGRRRIEGGIDPLGGLDADVWALRALDELDRRVRSEPWKPGSFSDELSAILRTYLEHRYLFPARERTTGEIQEEIQRALPGGAGERVAGELRAVLGMCDDVKFAGRLAAPEEGRDALGRARRLVEVTRPVRAAGGTGAGRGGPAAYPMPTMTSRRLPPHRGSVLGSRASGRGVS